jgi:hypothetical protein
VVANKSVGLSHPVIFTVLGPVSAFHWTPIHPDCAKRAHGFALAASGAGFGFGQLGMFHPVFGYEAEQVQGAGGHTAATTGALPGIDAGNGNALSNVHPDVS